MAQSPRAPGPRSELAPRPHLPPRPARGRSARPATVFSLGSSAWRLDSRLRMIRRAATMTIIIVAYDDRHSQRGIGGRDHPTADDRANGGSAREEGLAGNVVQRGA